MGYMVYIAYVAYMVYMVYIVYIAYVAYTFRFLRNVMRCKILRRGPSCTEGWALLRYFAVTLM
jgi:hypothetical protein